jgi:hypothetical protein
METTMDPVVSLLAAITLLILLAVTSFRFGVDSREGYFSHERDRALRGAD